MSMSMGGKRYALLFYALIFLLLLLTGRGRFVYSQAWGNSGFVILNQASRQMEEGKQADKAVDAFQRALLEPSWLLWRGQGFAFLLRGQGQAATAVWQNVPTMYGELLEWGDVAFEHKQYPQAVRWYQLATMLEPDTPQAWYQLGRSASRTDELDTAIVYYETALAKNYRYPSDIYCQLGWLYHWLRQPADLAKAQQLYEVGWKNGRFSTPDQAADCAFKQAELLLWLLNDPAGAVKQYNVTAALQPDNIQAQATAAFARYQADANLAAAEQQLHHLIEQNPQNVWPYWRLGDLYRLSQQFEKAETAYKQALQIEPNNSQLKWQQQQMALQFAPTNE